MTVKMVVFRDGETVVSSEYSGPCSEGRAPTIKYVADKGNDGTPDAVGYNCPDKMKITVPENLINRSFWRPLAVTKEDIAKAKPLFDGGKAEAMQTYADLQKALKDKTVYYKDIPFDNITIETYPCFKDPSGREVKVELETRGGEVWRIRIDREDGFRIVIDEPKMIADLGDLGDILDKQKVLPRI